MFNLFKRKERVETKTGQTWIGPRDNPFANDWFYRVIDVREHKGKRWVKYEAFIGGHPETTTTANVDLERDFVYGKVLLDEEVT